MTSRCLIVTDMDGTLLNHRDYDFRAVLPLLKQLEEGGIPVILNTSKTYAELRDWVGRLGNKHPFIVENGSAIYIPGAEGALFRPSLEEDEFDEQGDYLVITTGASIETLRAFCQARLPDALDLTACSLEEAVAATGLSEREVARAQDRQYSIPLQFGNAEQETEFAEAAREAGFGILWGGRFLHHMGATDKGRSMLRLKQLYEQVYDCSYRTIALGDSPNDLAMLEAADVAGIVSSPSSERLQPAHDALIRTANAAPEGWVEGVEKALARISIEI